MGNTFFTVVGTGIYTACTYCMDEYEFHSKYIQEAVLRMLKEKGVEIDKIVCLATKEARAANWDSFKRMKLGMKNRELRNVEVPESVQDFLMKQGLWDDKELTDKGLKELFADIYPKAKIECIDIPMGSDEDELLEIFETMYQAMDEKDNLYIDVTHGFRSMPMLYIPVIKYAEALKNISVEAIYYGAFEARGDKKPVFNLAIYKEILDWAFASQNFIQYGISEDLLKVVTKRQSIAIKNKDKSFCEANNFVKKLNSLIECIQTGRGNEIAVTNKGGVKQISKRSDCIRSEYQKLETIDYNKLTFPVLLPLLDNVKNSISEFAGSGNTATGLATIHWCAKKGMIQQGYTALEETIKSFACDLCGFENEVDKEIRDDLIGAAIVYCDKIIQNSGVHGEEKAIYYKENQSHFYEMIIENGWRLPSEDKLPQFKRILESMPLALANLSMEVRDKRNDINHFGMRNASSTPKNLLRIFNEQVSKFDKIYEEYKNIKES